jgi:hypothetical protein
MTGILLSEKSQKNVRLISKKAFISKIRFRDKSGNENVVGCL